MKNKLKKTHKKRIDYIMKRLGGISFVLAFVSVAFIMPLSNKFEKENMSINYNINLMEQQEKFAKPVPKYKELELVVKKVGDN